MIKRIYLAGAVTWLPYNEMYRQFFQAKQFLKDQGFDEVINHCELIPRATSWTDAMLTLITYLDKCNFLALLPGYQLSNGAMCEYHYAKGMESQGKLHAIIHLNMGENFQYATFAPKIK